MNYLLGMTAIPCMALGLLGAEPAAAQAQTQTMPVETFLVLDIDGDGQVDAIEFGVAMGAAFAHADNDADGVLSAEEAQVLALPPQVDADGNGQVTMIEFLTSVRGDFRGSDRDVDGILLP